MKSNTLTFESLRERSINDSIHRKKMDKIRLTHTNLIKNSNQYSKILRRGYEFQEKERSRAIQDANKQLKDKIKNALRHSSLNYTLPHRNQARTLNFSVRLRQAKRITAENAAFAKRLEDKPSCINSNELEKEFQRSSKYRKMISKANLLDKLREIDRKNSFFFE